MTRRSAVAFLALAATTAASLLLASCAGVSVGRYDEDAPGGPERSVQTTLHPTAAQARLAAGRQAMGEARFADAEAAFRDVYGDPAVKREWRADAAYQLGRLYAYALNPARDDTLAAAWFAKVTTEFPRTEFADEAERELAALRQRSGEVPPR